MSDLISRQALLKVFEEQKRKSDKFYEQIFFDAVMAIIENQPTAYDVDKVVEKIREQDGVCTGCKRQDECNECSIGERIEIIKRGGKDEIN